MINIAKSLIGDEEKRLDDAECNLENPVPGLQR